MEDTEVRSEEPLLLLLLLKTKQNHTAQQGSTADLACAFLFFTIRF